jgi:hypothetical protein
LRPPCGVSFFMVLCINSSIPNFHTIMKTCSRCGQTLMVFLKEVTDLLGFSQNVRIVKEKFVGNTIKPTNMPDADLKLTEDQYNDLMKNENCQICNVELTKKCIDHCHSTNKVRGVLCNNCNTALGL